MKGLDCSTDWPNSWNAKGEGAPLTEAGYYATISDPYSVYLCHDLADCPRGPPGACEGGRAGLVCNVCEEDGYYIDGETCEECPPYLRLAILIAIAAAICGCGGSYYAANGQLAVNADNPLAIGLFVGLAVTSLQVFTVFKDMTIPWPKEVDDMMGKSSSGFALDANSVSIECAVGREPAMAYLGQALLPYGLLSVVFTLYGGSRCLAVILKKPGVAWEIGKVLNVCGQIMQALFIAFCAIMVKPLQCYDHPNEKQSMLTYPRVICFEGGEHTTLMVMGGCIALGFTIPFIAFCAYGCWNAPVCSRDKNVQFLQTYRFLLYRFRPDYWWWGLPFLARQTTLAFATVLPGDNPHLQLFYVGATCSVYCACVCRVWPWIAPDLSWIDSLSMLILSMIMLVAGMFLPEPSAGKGRFGIMLGLFIMLAFVFAWFSIVVFKNVMRGGLFGEFGGKRPKRMELSKTFLDWLHYMHNLGNADVANTICKMNTFDRWAIVNVMSSWNAIAGEGYSAHPNRLLFLASKAKIDKDQVEHIAGKAPRQSWRQLAGSENTDQKSSGTGPTDVEHNTLIPRSFRVLASHGSTLAFPINRM